MNAVVSVSRIVLVVLQVLAQQILAIVIAIGCAHNSVNMLECGDARARQCLRRLVV